MEEITGGDIREEVLADIRNSAIDTDPLYAIFTSGSTGVPKGVLVCHRSVIDLAEQFSRTFHFTEDTIIGNQAPFDFDVSTKDIYVCSMEKVFTAYSALPPAALIRHAGCKVSMISSCRPLGKFTSTGQ